jgi:hypothetical protein
MSHLPHASCLSTLPAVDQYAAVELFRGTMVRHSVAAYQRDSAAAGERVCFGDDRCFDYVPIRVPDTICLRDRLPPGAAAVLINPTHTYTDLFLPIDVVELQLFEEIDGSRVIGEILDDTLRDDCTRFETGRRLFERLWRHDQIVVGAGLAAPDVTGQKTRHA